MRQVRAYSLESSHAIGIASAAGWRTRHTLTKICADVSDVDATLTPQLPVVRCSVLCVLARVRLLFTHVDTCDGASRFGACRSWRELGAGMQGWLFQDESDVVLIFFTEHLGVGS